MDFLPSMKLFSQTKNSRPPIPKISNLLLLIRGLVDSRLKFLIIYSNNFSIAYIQIDSWAIMLKVPFLEVYVLDRGKHRAKRTPGDCQENSEETRCCRYPLTVDFEAFGWDWIIAPKKYEANYCSGECPMTFMRKYPHTYVAWDMAKPSSTGPCCAPRKMKAISMLYFDLQFNIIYGLLPSMVVERCGCS